MGAFRVGITLVLVGAVMIVACGSEESGGGVCTARDQRSCECDSGLSGTQVCLQDETAFTPCACPAVPTDSGAGATGDGSSGAGGAAGSGGTSGAGGTPPEAGIDADTAIPEGGPADADAASANDASPEASVTPDASMDAPAADSSQCPATTADGAAPDACRLCMAESCCTLFLACVAPDPCAAGNEATCMLGCLGDIAADGGVVGQADLNSCSQVCAATGANVSPATRDLFACLRNATCRTDCGF